MSRGDRAWLLALVLASACGRSEARPPRRSPDVAPSPAADTTAAVAAAHAASAGVASASAPASAPASVHCARDDGFASPWSVPEASAAAEVELRPGLREILVVGDSGRHGAAMAWSARGGARALTLPLDAAASDDLEGMAWVRDPGGGRLETLTSSGAVRRYVANGAGGLVCAGGTYRIGAPPLSCPDLTGVNCGKNWEGLCLRAAGVRGPRGARERCAGYAASKHETALYCVERDDAGRLSIDPLQPPIVLSLPRLPGREGILSDCAFGAAGGPAEDVLLVTTNVFGGSTIYLVDEASGHATPLDVSSTLSNEAIAVDHEGALYAFMDDNGDTSVAARFTCTGWPAAR